MHVLTLHACTDTTRMYTHIHNDVSYPGKRLSQAPDTTAGHSDIQQTVAVISGNKIPRTITQI